MITVGNTDKHTDEEKAAIEAANTGFMAFIQTLPAEAVVVEGEGVYSSLSEKIRLQAARAADEQAAQDEQAKSSSSSKKGDSK